MSDTLATFLPAPRDTASADALAAGIGSFSPPLGEYLGAAAAEAFNTGTLAGRAIESTRLRRAELYAEEQDLAPLAEPDWRAGPLYREGLPYRPGLTVAAARALADIVDERQQRRALLSAGDPSFGRQALGFAAGVAASLPTPENFLPFAAPALRAAQGFRYARGLAAAIERGAQGGVGARLAAGAATGALDATIGNALVLPIIAANREAFGDDVTFADTALDLAFGAVGGAVLGGGAGAVLGRAAPTPAMQDTALRALTAAATDIAAGRSPDFSMASPVERLTIEALQAEIAKLRAMQQPEGDASVSGRAAARPLMASGAAAPGADTRITTPAGMEVTARWEVVEGADLITSHSLPDFKPDARFPPELQNRDRAAAERQAEVLDRAARLRPEQVEASATTDTGAPIVGPDGLVESGNGRTLSILSAYQQGLPTAQAYRAFLMRLGFDAAATMREPVLIRRRTSELDAAARRRFAEESNTPTIEALAPAEQALTDAQRLTPEVLALLRGRDPAAAANADFVRAFAGALPGREGRALSADGTLTADGATRVRRALAARAYGASPLIARLAQDPDALGPLGRALFDAAPQLARLRAAIDAGQVRPQLDFVPALMRAAQRIAQAADAGREPAAALRQGDLVDPPSPAEAAMLELLLRHPVRDQLGGVGRDTLAERMETMADRAMAAPRDPDMFGAPPPGLGDVLRAAFRAAGIEPQTALRDLDADTWQPPPVTPDPVPDVPEPSLPGAPARDPTVTAAETRGYDLANASAMRAEAERLAAGNALPLELAAELREALDLEVRMANADAAFQAAATCALGG
jgi:hypothetical protein